MPFLPIGLLSDHYFLNFGVYILLFWDFLPMIYEFNSYWLIYNAFSSIPYIRNWIDYTYPAIYLSIISWSR